MKLTNFDMLAIVGPTACGKTSFAVALAREFSGEVISADSRQIYKGMDIGTGKDLDEYNVNGIVTPYHLIDIVEAGYKYNVFEYQRDFLRAYTKVKENGNLPIMCGGSGMYVESVLKGYKLVPVPENPELREKLSSLSLDELKTILSGYKQLHNDTDTDTAKRAIRAIEIEEYYASCAVLQRDFPKLSTLTIGLDVDRQLRRDRISARLVERLQNGMIQEVEFLMDGGLTVEQLTYYGLEYKYVTLYITGVLSKTQMQEQLETAIHQFAKRQMTWLRGMQRRGIDIHWLDMKLSEPERIEMIKTWWNGKC